jgi:hypothetical protein
MELFGTDELLYVTLLRGSMRWFLGLVLNVVLGVLLNFFSE